MRPWGRRWRSWVGRWDIIITTLRATETVGKEVSQSDQD